ncbi:hypothetical protein [Escherichia coli]|uniref:hypothetical protein n=1 Tax=Escherichia coli TaxID=562 RepID=UPI0013001145|nr:hypothetical protein [Escherichia coli]
MDEKQLQALANELAQNLSPPGLFDRRLKKLSAEATSNAEMTHSPGVDICGWMTSAVRCPHPVP